MTRTDDQLVKLTRKKMSAAANDVVKSAKVVDLVYVRDVDAGIRRVKKGKKFAYVLGEKKLVDEEHLDRIKKLVIPPAWENVWICVYDNGHLQATGFDLKKRKQYRYHPRWNSLRNHTKFFRLYEFGKVLPVIRAQLAKDLVLPGLPPQKILSLVVHLMQTTSIRVGSGQYEKLYGSYGLTTLKDRHVKLSGDKIQFTFKGKKGVQQCVSLHNKRFAKLLKACRDIPGKELFQYIDAEGARHSIDSGMVNNYIKEISGSDFSAKDFRTWSGTLQALLAFKSLGSANTHMEAKEKTRQAIDIVSRHLGNTSAVCKKYYIHPAILSLFEDKRLDGYLAGLKETRANERQVTLSAEEKLLMKIFEKEKLI